MTSVTVTEQISVITFGNIAFDSESSFIYSVFAAAAKENINIDMISKAPVSAEHTSIGFSISDDDMPRMLRIANSIKTEKARAPMVSCGNAKIVVKSAEMIEGVGFAENVFKALANAGANPMLVTTAVDEISVIVRESDRHDSEREIRKIFGI